MSLQGKFACCGASEEKLQPLYKKPRLYVGICLTYACMITFNTAIYFVGFALIAQPDVATSGFARDLKHDSTRIIFLTLRGITIIGTDLFACLAMCRTRVSKFWIAFGFSVMSFTLSIVNSALNPSSLSRIDLDLDIVCFLLLLVLIREVYQLKKQREREVIRGGVQADYRC